MKKFDMVHVLVRNPRSGEVLHDGDTMCRPQVQGDGRVYVAYVGLVPASWVTTTEKE